MRIQLAALALGVVTLGSAPALDPAAPATGEAIFARAKDAWRTRVDAPYTTYGLLERYTWRDRTHDNWWRASFRAADRALALRRVLAPGADAQRLKGTAIGLHMRWHSSKMRVESLETNPDADAFPILDPLVDPNSSFGLLHRESRAQLVGTPPPTVEPQVTATPSPAPTPSSAALAGPNEKPLRELVRVEAVARDYRISLVGVERVLARDAYHLALVPVREPRLFRLRDLWVATGDYETLRLAVAGLFDGKPYDDARWTVTYVDFDGRPYIQQIRTDDTLRFGLDRYVAGLEYDFVQYDFPQSISPLEFERLF